MKSLLKLDKKHLKESSMSNREIADAIINAFGMTDIDGTYDTGYKSFILPNGKFLDLTMGGEYDADGIVHDVVYDWAIENKIITKSQKDFSFIVNELSWIRVNGGFLFIDLPEKSITSQQEQSLRDFIDTIYDDSENLDVSAGNKLASFSLEDTTTSKIILKIKRYYNTKELKEEIEKADIYYRFEIEKTDSFFRSLDSIWSVFVDEDGIVRDEYSGDLRKLEKIEDALEDIKQASNIFEDNLKVPGPKYFGYTKSAFTEQGYNKFKTEIESIMKALKVLGYDSFMYEIAVNPENIAYSDEYQILFTEEENYLDTDNLNESVVNASWSQVYKLIKDEFGVTGTPPKFSSYILPTGEFLDLEKWWKDYYGSEEEDYDDVIRQKLFKGISDKEVDWTNISPSSFPVHSYVQYFINSKLGIKNSNIKTTNRLQDEDDTLVANGCIKVNSGDTMYDNLYVNLPKKRPTNQALNSLDEYIFHQFFKNNKKNIRVYVEGNTWTAIKYEKEDYPDTSEIIKKITKYYTTNKLDESNNNDIKQQIKDAVKSENFGQYLPEFLYHATFSGTLDNIKKHGLGNFESGYKSLWKLQYKQGVYLDTDADSAESFVEVSDDERLDTEDIVIFKIPTSKLDHSLIEIDGNNDWNTDMLDENQFNSIEEYFSKVTYFYDGVIPFSLVTIDKSHSDIKESKKNDFHTIAENEFREINKFLDKLGFEAEYVKDYEFENDSVGMFLNSIQDNASVFSIALNEKSIRANGDDLRMDIKSTIAHEVGHGLFQYLNDIFDLNELDEENTVEEFGRDYCDNLLQYNELYKILKQYQKEDLKELKQDTKKNSIKLPTEKDVLDAVEKLSKRDGVSYNSLDNLFNATVLFITPNGSVLNATKWVEHESFLNEVFFEFIESVSWDTWNYDSDRGPYEYCVEKLKFITLNTGKGYSDYRCKVIIHDKLTSHQISLLQEWIKRRLDVGETQLIVFCKGNQKKYDLNQEDEKTMMKKIKSCVVRGFLENKDKKS